MALKISAALVYALLNVGWTREYDGFHSHDYVTLYGKGILQKYLRFPTGWLWVHQQEDDPKWAWPNQVLPLKQALGTLFRKKKKSPWILWVLSVTPINLIKLKNKN